MTANLEGIVAKIVRADEGIRQLETTLAPFLREQYTVTSVFDDGTKELQFNAVGDSVVPGQFRVLIGEVVHHLRSCLDHAVTQLAAIGPGGGREDRMEFPVCRTAASFKESCQRGKITGVAATAAKAIEALQPYLTSDPAEHATLWVLHDLDRIDKHRLLLVVVACVMMADQLEIDASRDVQIDGMSPPPTIGVRPSKAGTRVFAIQFSSQKYDPAVKVNGNFAFQLTFGHDGILQNEPVLPMLRRMRDCVVQSLATLFPDQLQTTIRTV